MNCRTCGAQMRPVPNRDYLVCDYCSNFHFPHPAPDGVKILGEASALPCPLCHQALVSGTIDNHPLLECERCQGLLMLMADFAELAQSRRREQHGPHPVPLEQNREPPCHLLCPRCRKWLDRHPYYGGPAHLMLDTCERCNLLWMERGVMAAMRGR